MNESAIQFLISHGASRWTKGGHDRMYLNDAVFAVIGLDCSYYNSGNLSSATLKGEEISNSYARKLISASERSYIDMETDTFHCANSTRVSNLSKMMSEWIENNK